MKKGDIKKQEILTVAEDLFCRKGYEETSVQDILDVLHSSKGSFYHHYESKESLLEAMCVRRAEQIARKCAEESEASPDPCRKLSRLMAGVIPLSDERLSFLLMLLPVFTTQEGKSVRNCYCDALANAFRPLIAEQIRRCAEEEIVNCRDAEISASLCLLVVNDLWCRICDRMISAAGAGEEMPDMTPMINQIRIAVERILSAPYGSMALVQLQDLKLLGDQIRLHWKAR